MVSIVLNTTHLVYTLGKIRKHLDSATGAHHLSFLNENEEGGILGFYFSKIYQALNENIKAKLSLNYLCTKSNFRAF